MILCCIEYTFAQVDEAAVQGVPLFQTCARLQRDGETQPSLRDGEVHPLRHPALKCRAKLTPPLTRRRSNRFFFTGSTRRGGSSRSATRHRSAGLNSRRR